MKNKIKNIRIVKSLFVPIFANLIWNIILSIINFLSRDIYPLWLIISCIFALILIIWFISTYKIDEKPLSKLNIETIMSEDDENNPNTCNQYILLKKNDALKVHELITLECLSEKYKTSKYYEYAATGYICEIKEQIKVRIVHCARTYDEDIKSQKPDFINNCRVTLTMNNKFIAHLEKVGNRQDSSPSDNGMVGSF